MTDTEDTSKAGDNEKKFRELICGKFPGILTGKRNFENKNPKVSISVDDSIEKDGITILIEIDSGNMAKLIVGQFCLLSQMPEILAKPEKYYFLVVHYYDKYNPERTKNNLSFISEKLDLKLEFNAINSADLEEDINVSENIDAFINKLKNHLTNGVADARMDLSTTGSRGERS